MRKTNLRFNGLFLALIDNQYFSYGLLLLTIFFFIMGLGMKPKEIIKIIGKTLDKTSGQSQHRPWG